MNNNRYYDPFSVLKKNNDSEKKLFEKNEYLDNKSVPYLLRIDNKEKVLLNKTEIKIGKKQELCDYVITDNKYIGRFHARILVENGECFFEDNNSTNKSYINNKQVSAGQKILLKDGDEIKLANLRFRFIFK